MVEFIKSLFRHFKIPNLRALIVANLFCAVPFVAALISPFLVPNLGIGSMLLLAGFLITGQALAVSGRVLDVRFRGETVTRGGLGRAWKAAWAEGLVVGLLLIVLFSLVFRSVPYYWEQGTAFSWFSLFVLAVGALLLLGSFPFFLPVRRREGLGLFASLARAVALMNSKPLMALVTAVFGLLSVVASVGTFGMFPGWIGLAALHQGMYDRMNTKPADEAVEGQK